MDREDDTLMAARRFAACCVVIVGYSLFVTAGLLIRLEAREWGLVLSTSAHAAIIRSVIVHGSTAILTLLLMVWAYRRGAIHPLLPRVTLALMPILLLASVDGLLKVVVRPPAVHPTVYMPHATRDWTFRPGSVGTHLGQPMRINSHGLPGPEIPYDKGDGEYRILFLGDSVAAGSGIPEEDCFVQGLSALWRASDGHGTITTVNCSVIAYSPWQQVDLLEREGMRYDPDVIVHVFCLNDYVDKFHLTRFGGYCSGPCEFVSPVLSRSGVYRAIHRLLARRPNRDKTRWKELLARYSVTRLIDQPEAPEFKDAWRITFENMGKMVAVARRHKRPFAIVCFPYAVQMAPGTVEQPAPQARLAQFAREHDVPFLDLLPAFRAYTHQHQLSVQDLFLDFCHPTKIGHAIAAREIRAFLIKHGLSP